MKYDLQLIFISFRLIIWIIGLAVLHGYCEWIDASSKNAHTLTEHTVDRKGCELNNTKKYIKSDEWFFFMKNVIVVNIDKENIARIGDGRGMSEEMAISAFSSIVDDKIPSGIMLLYQTKSESCDSLATHIKQMCISRGVNLFMKIPTGGVGVVNIAEQGSDDREQSSWEEIFWLVEATRQKKGQDSLSLNEVGFLPRSRPLGCTVDCKPNRLTIDSTHSRSPELGKGEKFK